MKATKIPKENFDVQIIISGDEALELYKKIGITSHAQRKECFGELGEVPDVFSRLRKAIDEVIN